VDSLFSPGATNAILAMSEVGGWLRGVAQRLDGPEPLDRDRLAAEMDRMSEEILRKRDELMGETT
jgi:hypothetical protein